MESRTPDDWGIIFEEKYKLYLRFTDKLKSLICSLLEENNIRIAQLEHRTKDIDSFIEKIEKNDYQNPLQEVTDLIGIRLITYYKEDIEQIVNLIENEFTIDFEKTIDKAQSLDPDRFGYLSRHYIISLSPPRNTLPEWEQFKEFKAEIQIRTVLQHAWGSISHKLYYKSDIEIPKYLKRKLFRLSALLELADEEFSNLRMITSEVEKQYEMELKRGQLDVDVDALSLDVYLTTSHTYQLLVDKSIRLGFKISHKEDILEYNFNELRRKALKLINLFKITTLKQINDIVVNANIWGTDLLSLFYNNIYAKYGKVTISFYALIEIIIIYRYKALVDQYKLKEIGFSEIDTEIVMGVLLGNF